MYYPYFPTLPTALCMPMAKKCNKLFKFKFSLSPPLSLPPSLPPYLPLLSLSPPSRLYPPTTHPPTHPFSLALSLSSFPSPSLNPLPFLREVPAARRAMTARAGAVYAGDRAT